jgi:hypothetical protein
MTEPLDEQALQARWNLSIDPDVAITFARRLRSEWERELAQEPVAWGVWHVYENESPQREDWDSIWSHKQFANDHLNEQLSNPDSEGILKTGRVVPLYTRPDAAQTTDVVQVPRQLLREVLETASRDSSCFASEANVTNADWAETAKDQEKIDLLLSMLSDATKEGGS